MTSKKDAGKFIFRAHSVCATSFISSSLGRGAREREMGKKFNEKFFIVKGMGKVRSLRNVKSKWVRGWGLEQRRETLILKLRLETLLLMFFSPQSWGQWTDAVVRLFLVRSSLKKFISVKQNWDENLFQIDRCMHNTEYEWQQTPGLYVSLEWVYRKISVGPRI